MFIRRTNGREQLRREIEQKVQKHSVMSFVDERSSCVCRRSRECGQRGPLGRATSKSAAESGKSDEAMKVDREESSAAVSSSVVEKTIKKRKRDKKATKSVVIDVEDVAGEEAPAVLATTATGCMVEEVDADASGNDAAKPSSRYIVFVGNLPYGMTEERLRAFLKMDDDLVEVRLPRNEKDRSRTKGYAFCELKTAAARQVRRVSTHWYRVIFLIIGLRNAFSTITRNSR